MHNFVVMHSFFLSLFIVMLVECCQSAWCEKNPQKNTDTDNTDTDAATPTH